MSKQGDEIRVLGHDPIADVVDEAWDRIERVLELHKPGRARVLWEGCGPLMVCDYCTQYVDRLDEDQFKWPCETVRILSDDDQWADTDGGSDAPQKR